MTINITDHMFKFGGMKYFRGNAHLVELGTIGEKKDPIGARAYIDPAGKIRASHLADRPIKQGRPLSIDWDQVKKADLEAAVSLKFFGMGINGPTSFDYAKAKRANLKLINYSIAENPLKRCLNNDANTARRSMFAEGNDARVVSEIWIVVEAELATALDQNFQHNGDFSYAGQNLKLDLSLGKTLNESISIGAGTVFAYKMHKVKKWKKKTDKIEDMEADYKGMG